MRNWGALLLLAVLAGCAGDGAGTAPDIRGAKGGGTGEVSGTAFLVVPPPDSHFVATKDVQVTLVRVGDLPPPTDGPGDTVQTARQGALIASVFLSDSVVPPPGSEPPPPPEACAEGETVAASTTNDAGKYTFSQLEPGVYNLLFEPPQASEQSPRKICGVAVLGDQATVVDYYFSP